MKKALFAALLALGSAIAVQAVIPTNDLVLGFRNDGSGAGVGTTSNIVVDLGSISNFVSGGSFYTPGTTVSTGINLASLNFASTFGSGFLTDAGLQYGVVGTNGNTTTTRTLYVSADATPSSLNGTANSTPWLVRSATSQSTQAAKFLTAYSNNNAGSATVTATSSSTSWTALETPAVIAFGQFDTGLFETQITGQADLYQMTPSAGTGTNGVYLGTFSIAGNGDVNFTAAIPEPSTYAAILGAVALAVAAYRRRKEVSMAA
jgi:hypothetical protein